MNLPKCVHGVAETATVDFNRADSPGWFIHDCQPQHFHPMLVGRTWAFLLQRLNGRRREPDFVELRLLLACAGNRQMGIVHRIKTSAENAETHELNARDWAGG